MDNKFNCQCGSKKWFICDKDHYIECVSCGLHYRINILSHIRLLEVVENEEENEKTEGGKEKE